MLLCSKPSTLIKMANPDVVIATQETYTKEELIELKKYCGKVVVLDPMATTSTSAKIRRLQISMAGRLEKILTPKLLQAIEESLEEVKK